MNRYPPKNVIRELRNESNFMCSVEDCDVPYLEYHHFDPPWHVENHHNPEGMIALCPMHHRQADGAAWTTAQLQHLKKINSTVDREQVKGKFNYLRNKFLLKAGGNLYYDNKFAEITLGDNRLVWFEDANEGFKALNIELFDQNHQTYFCVENNSWKISEHIQDIECPPNGKSLQVNFVNGNFIKIVFREITDYDTLAVHIDQRYVDNLVKELPITLVSVGLKLKEYQLYFQADKTIVGTNQIKNCLIHRNRVGLNL